MPLRESVELPPAVMFRRDDNYAVWDERGATARSGSWSYSTRLAEFPTSSRFFRREEVVETLALVKKGTRRLEATGISGAKRLGSKAFFLARWDDSGGKPWQEGLIEVDLSDAKPKPRVLGRFEGFSVARAIIDDKLSQVDGGLEVVTQGAKAWGVARYNPKQNAFTFRALGVKLQSYIPLTSGGGLYVETTSFGTTAAGEIELKTGKRRLLYQGRGLARFVDAALPRILVGTTPIGRLLVNTGTGVETAIGGADEVRHNGRYVIAWSPAESPKSARLFDSERLIELAAWKSK